MASDQPEGPTTPVGHVRVLQVIVFALIVGALFFLGYALFVNKLGTGGAPDFLCYLGIGFAVLEVVVHLIVPGFVQRNALQKVTKSQLDGLDADQKFMALFSARQTATIIACALLEGAAFLNVFAYMRSAWLWSLVTVLVLVFLLFLRMPTLGSAHNWVEQRVAEIESGF